MMQLVEPDFDLEASYLGYLDELGDGPRIPFPLAYPHQPFTRLIEKLKNQSMGVGVDEGFVSNTTFWLLRDGEIVGVSNLRHSLTPALERNGGHIGFGVRPSAQRQGVGTVLLAQTLVRARKIGLSQALVTCEKENLGSAGVILANGGQLEDERKDLACGKLIQRYWVPTPEAIM